MCLRTRSRMSVSVKFFRFVTTVTRPPFWFISSSFLGRESLNGLLPVFWACRSSKSLSSASLDSLWFSVQSFVILGLLSLSFSSSTSASSASSLSLSLSFSLSFSLSVFEFSSTFIGSLLFRSPIATWILERTKKHNYTVESLSKADMM